MELWELGKKISYSFGPVAAVFAVLSKLGVEVPVAILSTIIFAIAYILIWYHIRLSKLERW